ncbi:hypothetical protein M3Y99_01026300 [Aphelenchoides fujianensis]|nr:hypothetical protein M3Y99_01026300 [Aphelenchoides fujianensis]
MIPSAFVCATAVGFLSAALLLAAAFKHDGSTGGFAPPLGYASFNGAPDPLPSNDTNRPDGMIVRCYKTLCRDWLHECHWFCDKGKSWRCMECLSWRGAHCFDCFKLL